MFSIAFVSDFLNHHQFPLANEFHQITNGNYYFIESEPLPDSFKKAGYTIYGSVPYLISSWKSSHEFQKAKEIILESDVVIFENLAFIDQIKERLKQGKLTFECGERWLKKGVVNLLSPRLIKSQWLYHTFFYKSPVYRLCASAYAASDLKFMHSYVGRCFKWGYFTSVRNLDIDAIIKDRKSRSKTRFMSVGRLIDWKHHEVTIAAADILRNVGYDFKIDIYGSGPDETKLRKSIEKLNLQNTVHLRGNIDNELILEELQQHHALIFPSDKQEGWGAVVNEAMANACPVIGNIEAGAVPYLIKDKINGRIFEKNTGTGLAECMEEFMLAPSLAEDMARNAYSTMLDTWSPKKAAANFVLLVDSINGNRKSPIADGPGSITF